MSSGAVVGRGANKNYTAINKEKGEAGGEKSCQSPQALEKMQSFDPLADPNMGVKALAQLGLRFLRFFQCGSTVGQGYFSRSFC
jgi:hypothetical protein